MTDVHSKYCFIWVNCSFVGNYHDSAIFQTSQLYRQINGNSEDRQVITPLLLLVAYSAFPFCIRLLKPFKNA